MKKETVELRTGNQISHGILLVPESSRKTGVILAHGAGGNMHARFLTYFHTKIAEAGFACLKFNFPYSEARRKAPDRQQVLIDCYAAAMAAMPEKQVIIGGKSMGGRIASYLGDRENVAGLLFLGYPLHPPGNPEQLRDAHLYSIRKPMFFASGTRDPFARIDLLKPVLHKIGKHASFFLVEEGGHSFEVPKKSGKTEQEIWLAVLEAVAEWLDQTTSS